MALPLKPITVTTATVTLDRNIHRDTVTILSRAAGIAVTLPAATGTGDRYYLYVGTTISSNTTTITTSGSDTINGLVNTASTTFATSQGAEAAGGADKTITMNGTTTGGIVGSAIEYVDIATGVWSMQGNLVGSGTLATSIS